MGFGWHEWDVAHLLDGRIIAWPEGKCDVRQLLEVIGLHDPENGL